MSLNCKALAAILLIASLIGCGKPDATEQPSTEAPKSGMNVGSPEVEASRNKSRRDDNGESLLVEATPDMLPGIGLDIYPGAKVMKAFKAVTNESRGRKTTGFIIFTDDTPKKVGDFYMTRVKDAKKVNPDSTDNVVFAIDGKNSDGLDVRVQAQGVEGSRTTINILVQQP